MSELTDQVDAALAQLATDDDAISGLLAAKDAAYAIVQKALADSQAGEVADEAELQKALDALNAADAKIQALTGTSTSPTPTTPATPDPVTPDPTPTPTTPATPDPLPVSSTPATPDPASPSTPDPWPADPTTPDPVGDPATDPADPNAPGNPDLGSAPTVS